MSGKNASSLLLRFSTNGGASFQYIAMSTEASWSRAKEPRDITTKYSAGYREMSGDGKKTFEVSGSGWVVYASTNNHLTAASFDDIFKNNRRVFVEVVDVEDGLVRQLGEVEQANYDVSGGTEDTLTYDMQFTGHRWFATSYINYLDLYAASQGATAVAGDCLSSLITAYRAIPTT